MKERKNNVNTLLWLMVTLSVMIVFLTLSSCKSSVNPDGKGSKTPDDPNIPPAQKITITYSCSNNNGTIEAKVISSKEGKIEGNKIINLVSGDKVQFTAKPNNGYKFKGWVPATLGNKETFELTVDKDLSVSAEFGPIEKKSLTIDTLREKLKVKDEDEKAGKDSIVTSLYGLGLEKVPKEDDKFQWLYKYKKYKIDEIVSCIGEQLIKTMEDANITVEKNVPGLDTQLSSNFEGYSLGMVLDAKWNFAKNSEKIVPKEFMTFTFNDAAGRNERPSVVGLYELLSSDYYISYRNGEMYVEVANTGTHYFADWTFAFVNKSKPSEVYVFSVGEIGKDSEGKMKIKPYLLRDGGKYPEVLKVNRYKYLPALVALPGQVPEPTSEPEPESDPDRYRGMKLCRTYRFSLSSLLEDYLKQVSELEKWDKNYTNLEKIPDLGKEFVAEMLNDCDVYMTIGDCYNPNGETYSTHDNFRECWRNVLKLTDSEFWNKCFTN